MSLAESTKQTLHKHIMPHSRLVVGVSGGADSLALLHILHNLPPESAFALHVATLDHGLRGDAGAADMQFVVAICRAWGIPVTARRLNPDALPGGTEAAARAARYDFLAEVAHQTGAQHVAVAHHAGDQAETVLMRLLRGSGLHGLGGMAPAAPLPGHPHLTLIRPLLHATRARIDAYCREHDLHPRHDHTNQQTHLLRNRVRLEVLPWLRQINPQVDDALVRLAASARLDQDYIRQQLDHATQGHITHEAQRITLNQTVFRGLHPALRHHFILWAAGQLGGQDMTFEHVEQAAALAMRGTTGKQMPLPGGLRLRLSYDALVIEQQGAALPLPEMPLLPPGTTIPVQVPGITPLPGGRWQLHVSDTATAGAFPLSIHEGQTMILRTRRPGDRFAPRGMDGHTQKLKDWFINHKVPQPLRDHIPLLALDGEIVALMVEAGPILSQPSAAPPGQISTFYFHFTEISLS